MVSCLSTGFKLSGEGERASGRKTVERKGRGKKQRERERERRKERKNGLTVVDPILEWRTVYSRF